jgi:hypothetical protein
MKKYPRCFLVSSQVLGPMLFKHIIWNPARMCHKPMCGICGQRTTFAITANRIYRACSSSICSKSVSWSETPLPSLLQSLSLYSSNVRTRVRVRIRVSVGMVGRVSRDKSSPPPRRSLQGSQPAVYQLHLVQDLLFSKRHLDRCYWDLRVGTSLRCTAVQTSDCCCVDGKTCNFPRSVTR